MDNVETYTFPPPSMVSEPKGYGLSGKIMLSAIVILFAVVIIMVCLHVYARWYIIRARRRQIRRARRRTHLVFYVEPDHPAASIVPLPKRGLDTSLLKSLPTFTYPGGADVEEREKGFLECAVCLCEFEEGDKGRVLPKCNHSFHVECIDMWFHSHATCPICRAAVDGGETKEEPRVDPADSSELNESTRPSHEGVATSQGGEVVGTSSIGGRRKGLDLVGVSVEVPRRAHSFSFTSMDESSSSSTRSPGGFRSPTSRILSLKRILSREKKSPLPSPSGVGPSCESVTESDVELGRVEEGTSQPSPALTPR